MRNSKILYKTNKYSRWILSKYNKIELQVKYNEVGKIEDYKIIKGNEVINEFNSSNIYEYKRNNYANNEYAKRHKNWII